MISSLKEPPIQCAYNSVAQFGNSPRVALISNSSNSKGVEVIDVLVESKARGDWIVVTVTGEVDVYTAPKLKDELVGLIEEGKNQIVVDLEGVEFMDSSGLGVLVGALRRLKEREGTLALVCTKGPVLRILSITGLNKVFPVHQSVDEAASS